MRSLVLVLTVLSSSVWAKPQVDTKVWNAIKDDGEASSTVVVTLKDAYDLSKLPTNFTDQATQGRKVAEVLEAYTKKAISDAFPFLVVSPDSGVEEVTPIWIANAVRVTAKPEVLKKLTSWSGVESIRLETRKEISELEDTGLATLFPRPSWAPTVAWGVEKLRAPELWQGGFETLKIDGTGVLVAMIDSGITITHPDLAANIYKNPGETGLDTQGRDKATNKMDDDGNGFVDDVNGWNFDEKSNDVSDKNGHGTQTAGIVGGNGTNGTQTGVAPRVTMLPIRACCDLGGKAGETAIMEGMQYAIKMGAKVISMSLSIKYYSNPSYALWRRASETVLAANVIHVNSAGNLGQGAEPKNIGAPPSNPPAWFHAKQVQGKPSSMLTIGATDKEDKLRNYSSVGPVTWEDIAEFKDYPYEKGQKPGLIRPDVCGPSEVPSTSMDGKTYTKSFGGTSSATPHMGGVVALLVQLKPDLTPAEAIEALQMTALKVGNQDFGNECGAGRADVVAALGYIKDHFMRR